MTSANELAALAPCPFCGGNPIAFKPQNSGALWKFACTRCDAGPSSSLSFDAARDRWNTRTTSTAGVREAFVVTPLEWEKHPDDEEWYSVDAGHYQISDYVVDRNPVSTTAWRMRVRGHLLEEDFDNPESAKAAAQADYEQRIRSALVSSPTNSEWNAAVEVCAKIVSVAGFNARMNVRAARGPRERRIALTAERVAGEIEEAIRSLRRGEAQRTDGGVEVSK